MTVHVVIDAGGDNDEDGEAGATATGGRRDGGEAGVTVFYNRRGAGGTDETAIGGTWALTSDGEALTDGEAAADAAVTGAVTECQVAVLGESVAADPRVTFAWPAKYAQYR